MSDTNEMMSQSRRAMWFWVTLFFLGSFGSGIAGRILNLGTTTTMVLIASSMLFLIPMVRATDKYQSVAGCASTAQSAYNKRIVYLSLIYCATLFASIWLVDTYDVQGPLLWILAIIPAAPVVGIIWAVSRLILDEKDEFLRQKTIYASLIATAISLTVATIWGFLEMFNLVPHIWMWAIMPVWAIGLGIAFVIEKVRTS
ncbi:MAG: hypothetical protein ABL918_03410 [Chakrabartia sp.]